MEVLILLTSYTFLNEAFYIGLQAFPEKIRLESMGCLSYAQMTPQWSCVVLE